LLHNSKKCCTFVVELRGTIFNHNRPSISLFDIGRHVVRSKEIFEWTTQDLQNSQDNVSMSNVQSTIVLWIS